MLRFVSTATVAMGMALCLVATACSSGSATADGEGAAQEGASAATIDPATIELSEPIVFPVDGVPVVPPATRQRRWIERPDDRICIASVSGSAYDRTCADFDASIDLQSLAWSADGGALYFTENFRTFFEESDIWSIEVASGALSNLTDDGTDEVGDDRAVYDISPFVAGDGTMHFFSIEADFGRSELSALEEDGSVRSIPSASLGDTQPAGPVYPVGNDTFAYRSFVGDAGQQLLALDLETRQATEIVFPLFATPFVLASGPGAVVAADIEVLRRLDDEVVFELFDFRSDDLMRLDLDPARPFPAPALGFSPDGSILLAAVTTDDGTFRLVAIARDESGDFGAPIEIATAGFLGTDDDESPRVPFSFATVPQIVWTDDNWLLIPVDDAVLVYQLTFA